MSKIYGDINLAGNIYLTGYRLSSAGDLVFEDAYGSDTLNSLRNALDGYVTSSTFTSSSADQSQINRFILAALDGYFLADGSKQLSGNLTFDTVRSIYEGSNQILTVGRTTIANLEVVPVNVGYSLKLITPPTTYATEVSAVYNRMDHSVGQLTYALYGEIDTDQAFDGGSFTKIIHKGKGDAHYVGLMRDGYGFGYEASMFKDGANGFIATLQGNGGFSESVPSQPNCIGFQALWADDGVNPGFVPNYGMFYANNSPGRAYVSRMTSFVDTSQPQFSLTESDFRPRWTVFGKGHVYLYGDAATIGVTEQTSPELVLRGYYWTGTSTASQTLLKTVVAPGGTPSLYGYFGPPGGETLGVIFNAAGIDLQNHTLSTVGNITFYNSSGTLDLQGSSIANVNNLTFFSSSSLLNLQGGNITNVTDLTFAGGTKNLRTTLDGYANVPNTSAIGDGYVAFFIGSGRNIAGDNDLYWDRVLNSLKVGRAATFATGTKLSSSADGTLSISNSTDTTTSGILNLGPAGLSTSVQLSHNGSIFKVGDGNGTVTYLQAYQLFDSSGFSGYSFVCVPLGDSIGFSNTSGDSRNNIDAALVRTDSALLRVTTGLPANTGSLIASPLFGGINSGGNLILSSTTHATKGKVYFNRAQTTYYDESARTFNFDGYTQPVTDDAYSLGSETLRWKDLWLGPGSVHFRQNASENDSGAIRDWTASLNSAGDFLIRQGLDIHFRMSATGKNSFTIGRAATTGTTSDSLAIGPDATVGGSNVVVIGSGALSNSVSNVVIGKSASTSTFANGIAIGANASIGGDESTAIGSSATANGAGATAIGKQATGTGANSVVVGQLAVSTGDRSTVLGSNSTSIFTDAVVIGYNASAGDQYAVAIGSGPITQFKSVAVGYLASASNSSSIAIGPSSSAANGANVAVGSSASATTGASNTAVGANSSATGSIACTAYGNAASATGTNSTAIGKSATASQADTTAVGVMSSATATRTVAIGSSASAGGIDSVAVGDSARSSTATGASVFGADAYGTGDYAVALGYAAGVGGINSVAVGKSATTGPFNRAVVVGADAYAVADWGVALGANTYVNGAGSVAIGKRANASLFANAVVIGADAYGVAADIVVVGSNASAAGTGSIAIGKNATTGIAVNALAIGENAAVFNDNKGEIGTSAIPISLRGYGNLAWGHDAYSSINFYGETEVSGQIYSDLAGTLVPTAQSQNIDFRFGNSFVLNLGSATGNVEITLSTPRAGASYIIKIIQHATVAKTVSWPVNVKWPDGITPVISTGASAIDIVSLFYDGTTFYANSGQNYS